MANKVTSTIAVGMFSDGSSTTFSFDLLKDNYIVAGSAVSDGEGNVVNWFTTDPKLSGPTSVQSVSQTVPGGGGPTYTSSLSGTTVTVTLSAAVAAGGYGLLIYPVFG